MQKMKKAGQELEGFAESISWVYVSSDNQRPVFFQ